MYKIEVETQFEESWRFNVVVMCGGYSAAAEQLYVVSTEETIAQIEDHQAEPPRDYKLPRHIELSAAEADNIRALIYFIPHIAPLTRAVEEHAPFDIEITISRDCENIYTQTHSVNQWSGDSIEIKL